MTRFQRASLAIALVAPVATTQAATVETTDFIASPTGVMTFESLPDTSSYGLSYSESGITINQVNGANNNNGATNNIWTTYGAAYAGLEGGRSWYPNGGDYGYTSVTLVGGGPFNAVGFLAASGYTGNTNLSVYYELALAGTVVQSGTLTGQSYYGHWLGFSGGGFDEVRLRDASSFTSSLSDGQTNAFAVDSIKVAAAVPEPETYAMLLAGLGVLGFIGKRRRAS